MANPMRKAAYRAPGSRQKSVTPGQLLGLGATGVPQWREFSTEHAIREGFKSSHIVYSAIRRISQAAASVPWIVTEGAGNEAEDNPDHPLTKLLENPNPYTSGQDLIERACSHLYLGGNSLLTKIRSSRRGPVEELWSIMPDQVSPVPAERGFLSHYEVRAADGRRLPDLRPEDVCHLMFVDPANDYWGLAPLQAAARIVDMDVEALRWNKASLQHKAIPDGILSAPEKLSNEQYERMREQVRAKSGADNAREALILEEGLSWQQMSLSPAEMDFIESRKMTREDLLMVFGVPPAMVGLIVDSTHSDMGQMRQSFWIDTIIPLLRDMEAAFNLSLAPEYGAEVRVRPMLETVEELQTDYTDKVLAAWRLALLGTPLNEINRVMSLGLDEEQLPTGEEAFVDQSLVAADEVESADGEDGDDVIARILERQKRANAKKSARMRNGKH